MEAAPPLRSHLSRILLQAGRLSLLLIQNRTHLYRFLLLKIALFQHWVSGLAQEARGGCGSGQAHPPLGVVSCALDLVLQVGLAFLWAPLWLLLWGSRQVWAVGWDCARAVRLALQRLGTWEPLGLSVATWEDLVLSCLHSLTLVAFLLLLLTWRLFQKAGRLSLAWLPGQNSGALKALTLLKRLYQWVERMTEPTSWNLAYLITWTTCLASHLLQAAFEHTAQLAQAQDTEPQEISGPLCDTPLPESPISEAGGPVQPKPGTPGQ
uniref:transmembrane protein 270 n=1 Tax=Jaculus jaculus TaxID=51337 RepID=UPI001E1B241D|nr:transmembrane protein 270 [Jaculus jaculus]